MGKTCGLDGGGSDDSRLASLDGLRGAAAVAVVFYHMQDGIGLAPCPHGYVAVDVFYVLSGYVLARRYGAAISEGRLGSLAFLRLRAMRLLPMVWLGSILGCCLTLCAVAAGLSQATETDVISAFVLGCAMLPVMWDTSLGYDAYPLDGPLWSLFSEFAANSLWPVMARHSSIARVAMLVLLIGASGTIYGCAIFQGGAFGATPGSFGLGLSRVAWGFPAGIILHAMSRRLPMLHPICGLAGLITLICCPILGQWNGAWDAACILVLAPAIVAVSVKARLGRRGAGLAQAAGRLSYPLYALHAPLTRGAGWLLQVSAHGFGTKVGVTVLCLSVSLASAWAAVHWLEGPVRSILSRIVHLPQAWRRPHPPARA